MSLGMFNSSIVFYDFRKCIIIFLNLINGLNVSRNTATLPNTFFI